MPTSGFFLIGALSLFLALSAIFQYVRRRKAIQLVLVLLCIGAYFAAVVHFLWQPGAPEAKGSEDGLRFWETIAALFVAIIFGILAEVMYFWPDSTPALGRRRTDWRGIITPLFISPLIMIPTVAAFQNANIDLTKLGFPWLMILLTAFEKGFFWRHYMKKNQGKVPDRVASDPGAE